MVWFFGRSKSKAEEAEKDDKLDDESGTTDMDVPGDDGDNEETPPDQLEIMRDIVFRIREDEQFARSIYANCPRLQELLRKNPDLRPIFESQKLVSINFEKVYRDAGGVLPEDEDDEEEPGIIKRSYQSCMEKVAIITAHPIFKVFKIFMIIKKVLGFLSPTKGFGIVKGFFVGLFEDPDAEPDADADADGNPANLEAKMQLNAAAEHMEDPEVQERMDEMLENPDVMEETIENDPQLKALRDENPLCAELMNDPDTMRILVDPDNLRALGECPDLIEQDFSNPEGYVPEDVPEGELEEGEAEEEVAESALEVEEEESNMMDDIEDNKDDAETDKKASKGKGKQNKKGDQKEGETDEAKTWMQAAGGVAFGSAMGALGISSDMFMGDDMDMETPALEGEVPAEGVAVEGELPAEVVEEEGGIEVQEMEVEAEMGNKNKSGGGKGGSGGKGGEAGGAEAEGGGGGIFSNAMGAATGMVAGTALGSVLGDKLSMVEDFNEAYADEKEAQDEEAEKNGENVDDKKKGRFAFMGAMKSFAQDQLISNTLGAAVGSDLADGVLDTQEDIEGLNEEDEEEEEDEKPAASTQRQSGQGYSVRRR